MRTDLPFISLTLWSLAIAVLSLLPAETAISTGAGDKLEHGLAYAVLAILLRATFASPSMLKAWGFCTLFGGLIELGQVYSPGRYAEFMDMVANGTGAALGLSLYFAWATTLRRRQQ